MTPIADMIEKLSADGVPMASILLAVRTAELVASGGQSGGHRVDTAADRRRAWDRDRKREQRHLKLADSEWFPLVKSIIDRDGKLCKYCGSPDKLTADHVVPMTRGGTHDPENLVACCIPCNTKKGNKLIAEWMPQSADVHPISADTGFALSFLQTLETKTQKVEKKKEAAPRSRGHGLSDDWHPSESHYRIGTELHRSNADVDQEADAMRLWAKANAHRAVARKSDWESTFTGWLRRTWGQTGATNGQRSNHANRKSPGGDFFAGLAEVAAGLDRDGSMAGPADENIPSGRVNIEH